MNPGVPKLRRLAARASLVLLPALPAAAADAQPSVVVVTAHRAQYPSFDLPAAVGTIDAERIGDAQVRVNASEALAAIPGLVVQNRQNYAQDLQISSRGFGARSAFGVRGVRLLTDGIPATMPDGQGQAATLNLDMADRIEVVRGPFSALYGNHSGGVVQLFTRDPKGPPAVEANLFAGSDGGRKTDVSAQGSTGPFGYLLDVSRFETDGYREHSAATREQGYAKITTRPSADGRLTVVANTLRQDDTEDPLGVTWSTYQRNPRAGETDPSDMQSPKRTFAQRYNTRKSIDHRQLGASYEHRFGANRLNLTAYAGNRDVIQYQSFSKGFQQSASHSGGVVDFTRGFSGADINWSDTRDVGGGTLRSTIGVEYGRSRDDRRGYENFVGEQLGVKGRLRRDEADRVTTLDPYLQAEWQKGPWAFTAGLRHSRMKVDVDDRYLSNGDDSGGVRYRRTTPLAGILYRLTPTLNLYASAARGFETPTLNELFYSGSGEGFNFGLRPANSTHLEAGAKAIVGQHTRAEAALFEVRTRDELVVDVATGGRTSYRNGGKTLRQGLEVSAQSTLGNGWSARVAASVLKAVYEEGFRGVPAGSRLPGVPRASFFGELGWKERSGRVKAALEMIANGKIHPDDANAAIPAPGYAVFNGYAHASQQLGHWRLKQFARVNNLLGRSYIGSVIVGDANRRYYEPAPGRNWVLGFSARYQFQ